jgi:arsenate reductase-like glutaredoxin family protein
MQTNRDQMKYAVQEILNDVIEQGFHHLVNHPQNSDELNRIIKDATDELNYQLLKIDSHSFKPGSKELSDHFQCISKDAQRKSLELLSRLQKIQQLDIPRLKRI